MSTEITSLASEINAEHELASGAMRKALDHARRAGELLEEVKAQLPHGAFGPWLSEHFHGSDRTARAYMRIARNWPAIEKMAGSADLSIDGALRLIAAPKPATSAQGRGADYYTPQEMIERIAPGVVLTSTGLDIPRDMPFEQWKLLGDYLLSIAQITGALKPPARRVHTEYHVPLPAVGRTMRGDTGDVQLYIEPSVHAGYYFVTCWTNSGIEGTKKPVHASAVAIAAQAMFDVARRQIGVQVGAFTDVQWSDVAPVEDADGRFNHWLFDSHKQYVQDCVLGGAA